MQVDMGSASTMRKVASPSVLASLAQPVRAVPLWDQTLVVVVAPTSDDATVTKLNKAVCSYELLLCSGLHTCFFCFRCQSRQGEPPPAIT